MAIGQSISGGLAYKNSKEALKAQKQAAKELTANMNVARGDYLGRRPEAQAERQRALQAQLGLLGPANSLVNEMSGGKYSLNLGPEVARSPVNVTPLESQVYRGGLPSARELAKLQRQGYDTTNVLANTGKPDTKPGGLSGRTAARRGK